MKYLSFESNSCKDCYSCLRKCPVKAIRFVDNKAEIVEENCILCGHCVNVCPQNAKRVVSDVARVEQLIREYPGKVVLSVAPSFIANFAVSSFASFASACRKLGFFDVEETAVGAYFVTEEYASLLEGGAFRSLISTACPSAVAFIQRNYPDALKYVAPVVSPMIAHAKIIRKERGEDVKVVFVGPCIAKKKEADESSDVEVALTFEEIAQMFARHGIAFEEDDDEPSSNPARFYPIQRGIIKSFRSMNEGYDYVTIDGVEAIKDILENIDELDHLFIEMNMCEGGCVNGPARISGNNKIKDNYLVRRYAKKNRGSPIDESRGKVDLSHRYPPLSNPMKIPSEEEIQKILNRIFKYRKEDEINCGACGYDTCREKAIAVYNGLADPEYCLPYLKNKAESISNEIITHTPNGIITINREGILVDANARSFDYLQIDKRAIGRFYQELIDLPELMIAVEKGENVDSVIVYNDRNQKYFDVSITVVKEHGVAFAIYKDVTRETLDDEKMKALRKEMIEVTDQVINKQMAAVQEIASLLGESTAEAKIALVNFKNSLKDE